MRSEASVALQSAYRYEAVEILTAVVLTGIVFEHFVGIVLVLEGELPNVATCFTCDDKFFDLHVGHDASHPPLPLKEGTI
jgi:hypothetical protein